MELCLKVGQFQKKKKKKKRAKPIDLNPFQKGAEGRGFQLTTEQRPVGGRKLRGKWRDSESARGKHKTRKKARKKRKSKKIVRNKTTRKAERQRHTRKEDPCCTAYGESVRRNVALCKCGFPTKSEQRKTKVTKNLPKD
ncbi:hypothetical protein CAOG_009888 [Capsaspora owczarzaki ATCC 30864]|uniref:Uncharacterized protein n=1 Tax=Capsaspora owczarzaki (strain ATCC 30864) TaxID=595528 RepID=A0A0D2UJE6_CAPO3|nr:hypothetical protein CAOG_009888 [Capsaspora owczarzaki ATCC 30864]